MAFSLDPTIARRFGREGVESVVRAEGQLAESEITGTDAGSQIHAVSRSIAERQVDLDRIEARLRTPHLDQQERSRLEDQAQQTREEIRAGGSAREEQQASLATTPMVFRYASGEPTLGQTLQDAGTSFLDSAYILLRVLITLLPWGIAGAFAWTVYHLIRRSLARRAAASGEDRAA